MKSFREYLTESTKDHKLTLRFAAEMNEEDVNRIERFLGKYDLISMSRTSTTPVTKNPLFFIYILQVTFMQLHQLIIYYQR